MTQDGCVEAKVCSLGQLYGSCWSRQRGESKGGALEVAAGAVGGDVWRADGGWARRDGQREVSRATGVNQEPKYPMNVAVGTTLVATAGLEDISLVHVLPDAPMSQIQVFSNEKLCAALPSVLRNGRVSVSDSVLCRQETKCRVDRSEAKSVKPTRAQQCVTQLPTNKQHGEAIVREEACTCL